MKFICITSVLGFVKHFAGSVQTALELLDWTTEFLLDSPKLAATQCLVQCRKEAKATSQEFLEVKGQRIFKEFQPLIEESLLCYLCFSKNYSLICTKCLLILSRAPQAKYSQFKSYLRCFIQNMYFLSRE